MNPTAYLPTGHDPGGVALSVAIALLAAWVALDLAQRMRQAEARMALGLVHRWCGDHGHRRVVDALHRHAGAPPAR